MPAIKHQQRNACPEISLGEIHIPDDADLGTGTFTNTFSPRALPPTKVISSIMINAPSFQVAATVNPNSEITVALGRADGSNPRDHAIFILPRSVTRRASHTLRIEFAGWRILSASFDGQPIQKKVKSHIRPFKIQNSPRPATATPPPADRPVLAPTGAAVAPCDAPPAHERHPPRGSTSHAAACP